MGLQNSEGARGETRGKGKPLNKLQPLIQTSICGNIIRILGPRLCRNVGVFL